MASQRLSTLFAAAGLAFLAAGYFPLASAQDAFNIVIAPALTPWSADNQTRAYQGGSAVAELNLAKVFLGACTYRMMHSHIYADELLYVISGRLESRLVAPNNTAYNHTLAVGDNVVYPKGWMHYQYNPSCKQTQTLIAFNAKSIGTVNVPLSLAASLPSYLSAAYNVTKFPAPAGLWVVDRACARRCKL